MPGKGLLAYEQAKLEKIAAQEAFKNNGGFFNKLFLRDKGDYAVIRFLEPAEDVSFFGFHTIRKVTQAGKELYVDIMCPAQDEESGISDCPCDVVPVELRGKSSTQIPVWVWVSELGKKDTPWPGENPGKEVRQGRETFYVKEENRVYVLPLKSAMFDLVMKIYNKRETINDRDYRFERISGKGDGKKATTYSFEEEGSPYPFELPDDIVLPSISAWVVQQSDRAIGGSPRAYYNYLRETPVVDGEDEASIPEDDENSPF